MRQRGNTLAATLVAVVIVMLLVVVYFYGGFPGAKTTAQGGQQTGRKDGLGVTVPGRARYAAKDEECKSNLGQIRQFFMVHQASGDDDKPPASLDDAAVPAGIRSCPVGHEAYEYDPVSGKVHCPHPGHEGY